MQKRFPFLCGFVRSAEPAVERRNRKFLHPDPVPLLFQLKHFFLARFAKASIPDKCDDLLQFAAVKPTPVFAAPVQDDAGASREVFVIHQLPAFGAGNIGALRLMDLDKGVARGFGLKFEHRLLILFVGANALEIFLPDP